MEQLVILLVIGAISLINWAIKKSQEKRAAEEALREGVAERAQRHAARRARTAPSADPMRELREALGLPPDAAAPPPVAPREVEEFSSLEEISAQGEPAIRWSAGVRAPDEKTRALASALEAAEQSEELGSRGEEAGGGGWRPLLSGRDAQRRAFVASEIFGRPRALCPFAWR